MSSSLFNIVLNSSVHTVDCEKIVSEYSRSSCLLSKRRGHLGRRRWLMSSSSRPQSSQFPVFVVAKCLRREPTRYRPLNIRNCTIILLISYEWPAVVRMRRGLRRRDINCGLKYFKEVNSVCQKSTILVLIRDLNFGLEIGSDNKRRGWGRWYLKQSEVIWANQYLSLYVFFRRISLAIWFRIFPGRLHIILNKTSCFMWRMASPGGSQPS